MTVTRNAATIGHRRPATWSPRPRRRAASRAAAAGSSAAAGSRRSRWRGRPERRSPARPRRSGCRARRGRRPPGRASSPGPAGRARAGTAHVGPPWRVAAATAGPMSSVSRIGRVTVMREQRDRDHRDQAEQPEQRRPGRDREQDEGRMHVALAPDAVPAEQAASAMAAAARPTMTAIAGRRRRAPGSPGRRPGRRHDPAEVRDEAEQEHDRDQRPGERHAKGVSRTNATIASSRRQDQRPAHETPTRPMPAARSTSASRLPRLELVGQPRPAAVAVLEEEEQEEPAEDEHGPDADGVADDRLEVRQRQLADRRRPCC